MVWALELLRRWWPVMAFLLIFGASHWSAYTLGKATERALWQAQWAQRDADDASAQAGAERAARAKEQADQLHSEKVQRDATQALEQERLNAAGERAATDRLRGELTELQARISAAGKSAATASSSASATRAAMVLSDLYGGCQNRLGEISSAFDRARIAGLTCEKSYSRISQ